MASKRQEAGEHEKGGDATMQLMKEQYKSNRPGSQQSSDTSRIWIGIAVFFCLTTFICVGVLIWRETRSKDIEQTVVERFPGFFRTIGEQFDYEVEYLNVSTYKPVNSSTVDDLLCSVNCNKDWSSWAVNAGKTESIGGVRKKRTSSNRQTTHHACCMTTVTFKPEDYLFNVLEQRKKIAQFHSKKQYFKFEECSHVTNFHYGRCQQRQDYVTAITEDQDRDEGDFGKYKIEWLQVPGCCKCLNS